VRWGRYLGALLGVMGGTSAVFVAAVVVCWSLGLGDSAAQRLELWWGLRGVLCLAPLASGCAWWFGMSRWPQIEARRRLGALRSQLGDRLAGVAIARRGEVERAFLLEAQRDVLAAQRARYGGAPQVMRWRDALRARWDVGQSGVFGLWPVVLWSYCIAPFVFSDLHAVWFGLDDGLRLAAAVSFVWAALCAWEVAVTRLSSLEDVREAERERRLLAELAQLAGGQVPDEREVAVAAQGICAEPEGAGALPVAYAMMLGEVVLLMIHSPIELVVGAPLLLVILCARGVARWVWRSYGEARRRAAQRARLDAQLVALAPGDARRVAVTRRFWQEALRAALAEQRPDDTQAMAPPSSRGAARCTPGDAVALAFMFAGVFMGMYVLLMQLSGHKIDAVGSIALFCVIAILFVCAALGALAVEGGLIARQRRARRGVLAREHRRLATLAELAGGLSLAEHVADAALVGALSGEVTRSGALSGVEP
jgi:hypothetical protein